MKTKLLLFTLAIMSSMLNYSQTTLIDYDFEPGGAGNVASFTTGATSSLSLVADPMDAGNQVLKFLNNVDGFSFAGISYAALPAGKITTITFRAYHEVPATTFATSTYYTGNAANNRVFIQLVDGEYNVINTNGTTPDIPTTGGSGDSEVWHNVEFVFNPTALRVTVTVDGEAIVFENGVDGATITASELEGLFRFDIGNRLGNTSYLDDLKIVYSDTTLTTVNFDESIGSIYPNPVSSDLIIKMVDSNLYSAKIYSILGEEIKSVTQFTDNTKVSLEGLNSGVYLVKIEGEKSSFVKKVIKL